MHHISFETTRALIEQHHQELLQEAELRRIVRRLRHPIHEPAPTSVGCPDGRPESADGVATFRPPIRVSYRATEPRHGPSAA